MNRTCVHWAAIKGHAKVLNRLLQANVDIRCKADEGRDCLHLAVENGDKETIETLLKHCCDTSSTDAVSI